MYMDMPEWVANAFLLQMLESQCYSAKEDNNRVLFKKTQTSRLLKVTRARLVQLFPVLEDLGFGTVNADGDFETSYAFRDFCRRADIDEDDIHTDFRAILESFVNAGFDGMMRIVNEHDIKGEVKNTGYHGVLNRYVYVVPDEGELMLFRLAA